MSATGLIVPVDVAAFCVGTVDANERTSALAGATTVYSDPVDQAFLGDDARRDLSEGAVHPLQQGVHLHWALPDGLTRATTEGGGLRFPPVPNRWLVTRLEVEGQSPTATSWIVESDTLGPPVAVEPFPVTVLTATGPDGTQGVSGMGRSQPLDGAWTSPRSQLGALTDDHLSAVSRGMATFSAYYPDSRTVFGFCDRLADVTVTGTSARLAYVVTGWHDEPADDPARTNLTLEVLQSTLRWTYTPVAGDAPSFCVYNGFVQAVTWNPGTPYVHPSPPPIAATAAIGNNPAEALSAYLAAAQATASPLFEPLLNAFQMGLLTSLEDPAPDQLAALAAALRDKQFRANDAGVVHTVGWAPAAGGGEADGDGVVNGGPDEVLALPPRLADDLNLLNLRQQRYDLGAAHADAFRWQLFADWYRMWKAGTAEVENAAQQLVYWRAGQWNALNTALGNLAEDLTDQLSVVRGQLTAGQVLTAVPAPRYRQPTDPVLLLAAPELTYPARYGGDGRFHPDGYLVCRLSNQTVSAITVAGITLDAGQLPAVALPSPNNLPYAEVCARLLVEACLLDTAVAGARSGADPAALRRALQALARGDAQTAYQVTGQPPSPVGLTWWDGNPFLPLLLSWSVELLPLFAITEGDKAPASYDPRFFTANFSVAADTGGAVTYAPAAAGGIGVDPANEPFPQSYTGQSLLQASPAAQLADRLRGYLATRHDAGLDAVAAMLEATPVVVQPLSGFTDGLVMRRPDVQLPVTAGSTADRYKAQLTGRVAPIVGDHNHVGPDFNSYFNPIRAGWAKVSARVVDAFGQRRDVAISSLACAAAMATVDGHGTPVPSVAYLEPRLAQPARLLFRWLAADTTGYDEMTAHPATSPVCGWLLPDHRDGSLFVYDQRGRPLGTLFVDGTAGAVGWQSAPGDDDTIDAPVETVLRFENPHLRALALALKQGSPAFFQAMWRAIDNAHATINPPDPGAARGVAVLIGRPVAVVQASLRLEVEGRPAVNLSWACFQGGEYNETDSALSSVGFPVALGDRSRLSDGLIGFFKQASPGGPYDLGRFYSEAAPPGPNSGVVTPSATTLVLTVTPTLDDAEPPALDAATAKVLMLMDPRAAVHATTGILPTKAITIPSDIADDAVGRLEASFLVAPVLRASGGLALPFPAESGYQFSWVEEVKGAGGRRWAVTPDVGPAASQAVWEYSPQTLTEGWARMNPVVLEFRLADSRGQPVARRGVATVMFVAVVNRRLRPVTFTPGELVDEGQPSAGSVVYLHLGDLVAQADVPRLQPAAPGWIFADLSTPTYGRYWAATPTTPVTLDPGGCLHLSLANLVATATGAQATVYADYYNVDGVSDGVYDAIVAVEVAS